MKLLHLKNFPIFRQLQIEEALLRTSDENFCIINEGTPPAIVMGISGKLNELVHEERHSKNPIPIIKRFSGGGTVVVDTDTIFVSFLFQKDFHDFAPYPEPIMKWTEGFYQKAFDMPDFLDKRKRLCDWHKKMRRQCSVSAEKSLAPPHNIFMEFSKISYGSFAPSKQNSTI